MNSITLYILTSIQGLCYPKAALSHLRQNIWILIVVNTNIVTPDRVLEDLKSHQLGNKKNERSIKVAKLDSSTGYTRTHWETFGQMWKIDLRPTIEE